ncbi:hypothetical protein F4677DRAFT_362407 [Hypoxylon crocopeplum]|nr:hypothetical protein F4677DRAFT_362407 [Hypoxylon crocopeplum]
MLNQQSAVVKELAMIHDTSIKLNMKRNQTLLKLKYDILGELEELKQSFSQKALEDTSKRIREMRQVNPDSISELSSRLRKLSASMIQLEEQGKTTASDQKFLQSLYFQRFMARHDKIETAHSQTFEWMFTDTHNQITNPRRFVEWLRSKHGHFWIQGKAGSGKSTLMKFLWHHRSTTRHLQHWAGTDKLVMANYFFWATGNELQKSQEGLLRTLLFETLRSCPELIPRAREAALQKEDWVMYAAQDAWSLASLKKMFLVVMKQELPAKFCFFIDGLDEYKGNNQELIELIQGITAYPSVKACTSSRPWVEFKHAFDHDVSWQIKLEDLTAEDIRRYVQDRLNENKQFKGLKQNDATYGDISNEVMKRAQGVFLWVFLVVRSLLEGARYADNVNEMRHRLDRFPEGLEEFFKHMLEDIPPFYRSQTYRTFKIATTADGPLPLVIHSFAEDIALQPRFALTIDMSPLPVEELLSKIKKLPDRLDARCKGLLEVVRRNDISSLYYQYDVDFLHRTVRDFLNNSTEVSEMFQQDLDDGFNPSLTLCHAFLADVKLVCRPPSSTSYMFESQFGETTYVPTDRPSDSASTVLTYARQAQTELKDTMILDPILDEAERVLFSPGSSWPYKHHEKTAFLGEAIKFGLYDYVDRRLTRGLQGESNPMFSSVVRPLLDYTLQIDADAPPIDPVMVKCLLKHGANPNQKYWNGTVWTQFLRRVAHDMTIARHHLTRDAIGFLIEHNADLTGIIIVPSTFMYEEMNTRWNQQSIRFQWNLSDDAMKASDVIAAFYPDSHEELFARAPSRSKSRNSYSTIASRLLGLGGLDSPVR